MPKLTPYQRCFNAISEAYYAAEAIHGSAAFAALADLLAARAEAVASDPSALLSNRETAALATATGRAKLDALIDKIK